MNQLKQKRLWLAAVILLADVMLFAGTDATKVPSFVVFVGFLLLVATLYVLIYGLLGLSRVYGLPLKHKQQLSVYLTAVVGSLVALQSIGELSGRDVLVLLPLSIIGYVYSAYARSNRRNLDS